MRDVNSMQKKSSGCFYFARAPLVQVGNSWESLEEGLVSRAWKSVGKKTISLKVLGKVWEFYQEIVCDSEEIIIM